MGAVSKLKAKKKKNEQNLYPTLVTLLELKYFMMEGTKYEAKDERYFKGSARAKKVEKNWLRA